MLNMTVHWNEGLSLFFSFSFSYFFSTTTQHDSFQFFSSSSLQWYGWTLRLPVEIQITFEGTAEAIFLQSLIDFFCPPTPFWELLCFPQASGCPTVSTYTSKHSWRECSAVRQVSTSSHMKPFFILCKQSNYSRMFFNVNEFPELKGSTSSLKTVKISYIQQHYVDMFYTEYVLYFFLLSYF